MSYQIAIPKNRKAAARFIGKVRRRLQEMLADEPEISRTEIADVIGVHRSVITRQLNGHADMSLGRVAEIAWAAGYRPTFDLIKIEKGERHNAQEVVAPAKQAVTPAVYLATTSSSSETVDVLPAQPKVLVGVQ